MNEIWLRIKGEPAVTIGLLLSIGLVIVNILGHTTWDAQTILFVIGPFAAALGIRPAVKPMATIEAENKAKALSNLQQP